MLAPMSPIDAVWSPRTREHVPNAEIWVGVRIPGTEVSERVDVLVDTLTTQGHRLVEAQAHDDAALTSVHDPELVAHLASVHERWMASGIPEEVGQDRVVPYVFPTAAMLGGIPRTSASAVHALAGTYCYDTMTVVAEGTWPAVRAAADCALTAADRVVAGARAVYALSRPPGHHVTREAYGGSCYLNNAALAAQALRQAGHERVSVIDVDAHHGNGTSAIFYDRADVLYGSVHVDPAAGWFPHYVGHAHEKGAREGLGANVNVPLRPGSGDGAFLDGVSTLAAAAVDHGSSALVVSLGVDAAADDPESPLEVTLDGYRAAAERLASLGLPTVLVQEGGYHLPSLGGLVTGFLSAFG
jgi:acetoin utilization deacetylase AcuC-like enzyme